MPTTRCSRDRRQGAGATGPLTWKTRIFLGGRRNLSFDQLTGAKTMMSKGTSRRDYLKLMAASAGLAATAPASWAQDAVKKTMAADPQAPPPDHDRRIQWWQQAKFGMFIHWGLYSLIGRHEWAMEMEGIPIPQYELLAKHFNPKPNAARAWAKLATQAGQKYMVMTSKHHEGFCNFDTKLTNYCAPKQGPKPDGSIPEESVRILSEVGHWTSRNGESIHTQDRCQPHRSNYAGFTRKGNTLYMHVYFWPGETVALAGLKTGVKSTRLLVSGQQVKFQQDRFRVRFTGLHSEAPDHPVTTIAIECESEPLQDTDFVRRERPRNNV